MDKGKVNAALGALIGISFCAGWVVFMAVNLGLIKDILKQWLCLWC